MIHYDLRCNDGHTFDGWFKDSTAFDQQAARGQLDCPVCGATTVTRAIMAPRLSRGARAPKVIDAAPSPEAPSTEIAAGGLPPMPDHVRAVLQRVRAEVEKRCEYVGPSFAEEARRIHDGKTPPRAIYGETTQDQAEALSEDGIDVARIPWVPRADS